MQTSGFADAIASRKYHGGGRIDDCCSIDSNSWAEHPKAGAGWGDRSFAFIPGSVQSTPSQSINKDRRVAAIERQLSQIVEAIQGMLRQVKEEMADARRQTVQRIDWMASQTRATQQEEGDGESETQQHPVCPPPLAQRQWARALSQPLRSNSRNEFGLGIHWKWASRVLRLSK